MIYYHCTLSSEASAVEIGDLGYLFYGSALKTLVGTATDEDLKVIDEHVKVIAAECEFHEMKNFPNT